jgi:hypothetical protein
MGSAHPHSAQNRRSELFSVLQLAQRILEPSQGDGHPQAKVCYGFFHCEQVAHAPARILNNLASRVDVFRCKARHSLPRRDYDHPHRLHRPWRPNRPRPCRQSESAGRSITDVTPLDDELVPKLELLQSNATSENLSDEAVFPGPRSRPETMICINAVDQTTRCGHVGIHPQFDLPAFLQKIFGRRSNVPTVDLSVLLFSA